MSHSRQDACAGYTLIYLSKYEVPELFLHPATFIIWRREGELCYIVPVEVVLWYWTRRKVSIQDSLLTGSGPILGSDDLCNNVLDFSES